MVKKCRSCGENKSWDEFHQYRRSGRPRPDCKTCHNKLSGQYRIAHPDEHRAALLRSRAKHLERRREESTQWRIKNRELARAFTRRWTAENKNKIKEKSRKAKALCLGACSRCVALIQATPKWLTHAQKEAISQVYLGCPEGKQVDHIVPIRGHNVCGLNVSWNLQYLTPSENSIKGNRYA